jgi:hypothetical protein
MITGNETTSEAEICLLTGNAEIGGSATERAALLVVSPEFMGKDGGIFDGTAEYLEALKNQREK